MEVDRQWNSLQRTVRDHHFNHAVEVFVPEDCLPSAVSSTPPPYYLAHLPLSHFLQPHLRTRYFEAAVKEPAPLALSLGRKVDVHSVFALIPPGILLLSVDKDLYELLGLPGTPSRFQKHRHVVQVDLTAPSFIPGKPGFERVKRCLGERPELRADFILTWDSKDLSSQEKFMQDFNAERFANVEDCFPLTDLCLPLIRGKCPHGCYDNGEVTAGSAGDIHTWLGGVACGVDFEEGAPGDYVSAFTMPEPHIPEQHGTRTRWSGMVTATHICSILQAIRAYLSDGGSNAPWAALSVWGFEDAPVSWRTNEHGWFLSGDNHYQVVLFRTGQFWIIKTLATHDIHG